MRRGRSAAVLVLVLGVPAAACQADTSGPELPVAAVLEKESGDGQEWYLGNPLPEPYSVRARDAGGSPVEGVTVTWTVTSGEGSAEPRESVTDADGLAASVHILGTGATVQHLTASSAGLPSLLFAATAQAAPASATVEVGDDFFAPADVVVRAGGPVTWSWNPGTTFHNVTFTSGPVPLPPSSPTQEAGSYQTTFQTVARYAYVCTLHGGMEGTVTVVR